MKLAKDARVFGIGLAKTGTRSLAAGLNLLGIPTIHWPRDSKTVSELQAGIYRLSILERYTAATDVPIPTFFAQLDAVYPGSKFIFTVRDVDDWLLSARKHFESNEVDKTKLDSRTFYRAATYGVLDFNEHRFRFVYETHRRTVEAYFRDRPENLLVLDICAGAGWNELCPFLGLDVPPEPFPHENSTRKLERWKVGVEGVKDEISRLVRADETYILVDDDKLRSPAQAWTGALPFVEREGAYWGRPRDSREAIDEVERLRSRGAAMIAFTFPSFWWLEHYSELHEHLRAQYPCTVENERVIAFDLRPRSSQGRAGTYVSHTEGSP